MAVSQIFDAQGAGSNTIEGTEDEATDDINPADYPAVTFEDKITVSAGSLNTDTKAGANLDNETELTVHVEADECTFPAGTMMQLADADPNLVAEAVEGTVDGKTKGFHAVDISFWSAPSDDPTGEPVEIEPLKPIRVSITSEAIKQAVEDSSTAPVVVHVEDAQNDRVDKEAKAEEADSTDAADSAKSDENSNAVASEGSGESAYTDETANVGEPENNTVENDKEPGNPKDSAEDSPVVTIIEAEETLSPDVVDGTDSNTDTLTFEVGTFSVYAVVYTVDFHYEVDGKTYDFSIPGGGFVSLEHIVEMLGIASTDENTVAGAENAENGDENENEFEGEMPGVEEAGTYEQAIKLNSVEVSGAAKEFVEDVESVEFSSPELVWVGKVDEAATVGGLKEANGLQAEYSADLTEEQIAEINAQTVEAGDWALISVQPFNTDETLTVTMKNGEKFMVEVTDAQISTHVITADGEDYIITVTYGHEAGIPDGSTLGAAEIPKGSELYETYLKKTKEALSPSNGIDVNVHFARYFDITIYDANGNEIEPEDDVSVSIKYADVVDLINGNASVVHFADDGTEVLKAETRRDVDEGREKSVNVFEFKQGSFSVSGTVVSADSITTAQYFIVAESNGRYYALKNDGSAVPVTYNVKDTIDSGFYPVSTDGTPLQEGDWINLNGVKMTSHTASTPHGVIGKDNNNDWTVTWENQNITWPNTQHPEGWHGRVHVKAKEDFLGGNTIPTNENASIEAKKLIDPLTNITYDFDDLYSPDDYSLSTSPVEPESPYVNVDELYIPPQTTEWTVYRGTEVDPLTQMKEMYKNTNVYEVVKQESQDHRMSNPSDMVYALTNGSSNFVYMNAIADNRAENGVKRNPVPLSYYLINCTEEKEDLTEAEWQTLISGGKVSRRYTEYDHVPGTVI